MTYGERTFAIDFDFIEHLLLILDSDSAVRTFPLDARSATFTRQFSRSSPRSTCRQYQAAAGIPVTTPVQRRHEHRATTARRPSFWEALRRIEPVFETFPRRLSRQVQPGAFFWGAFDLAVSRFNGRRAPLRKANVDRDAYDEEVISLGFWPGDPWTGATDAMFYSYTVPEPAGCGRVRAPRRRVFQRR